jgi:hypothetical protein
VRDSAQLWDVQTGHALLSKTIDQLGVRCPLSFLDETSVISPDQSGALVIWSASSGRVLRTFGGVYAPSSLAVSPNRGLLFAGKEDGTIQILEPDTANLLAKMFVGRRGDDWFASDPAGRFDAGSLTTNPDFSWIAADDPLRPLPPEIFMRDYYEPQLLPRLLACHEAERQGDTGHACVCRQNISDIWFGNLREYLAHLV